MEKNIRKENKKRLFNSILKPILTYGAEVWQLTKKSENKLLTTEMDFWRRTAGRSRQEKIRNKDIRT